MVKPKRQAVKTAKHRHFVASHPVSGTQVSLLRVLLLAIVILFSAAGSQIATAWRLVSVPSGDISFGLSLQQTTLEPLSKKASCFNGTVLNVVAHQDDDILFMNPHLQQAINKHKCIRSVYVTAGDDGRSARYWQSREHGIEAAYAFMYGITSNWTSSTATVAGHSVEVAYLANQPLVALTFLHLPDGNPSGTGFASHHDDTLNDLRHGSIPRIHTVDGNASYTHSQLILTLRAIMTIDMPDEINTQAYSTKLSPDDHSDHQAVGYFADQAQKMYNDKHSITFYLGYQLNKMQSNLSAGQATRKAAIFGVYSQYDITICTNQTNETCPDETTYSNYFSRQYTAQPPRAGKH